jgi:hypothetical protein
MCIVFVKWLVRYLWPGWRQVARGAVQVLGLRSLRSMSSNEPKVIHHATGDPGAESVAWLMTAEVGPTARRSWPQLTGSCGQSAANWDVRKLRRTNGVVQRY